MRIGWIDFSEKDRKRAIDVLHLLNEGAVDELGIGVVRDAFADYFFPGTSTIMTRAKYFLIVPYAIKEACAKYPSDIRAVYQELEKIEKNCAQQMKEHGGQSVIGATILPKWVVRQPSIIYWNGIRTWGLMRENLSMREAIQAEMAMVIERKQKRNNWSIEGEEGIQDDVNAGQMEGVLWNLPNSYNGKHWRENLHVELTEDEATHLKELILGSKTPLMVYSLLRTIIENEIDLESIEGNGENSFETFAHAMKPFVSTKMWERMDMAMRFNKLVYLLRVQYNALLDNKYEERFVEERKQYVEDIRGLDLEKLFCTMGVHGSVTTFLREAKQYVEDGKESELKECIIEREIRLKTRKRSKILHKELYQSQWIGGTWLDYRLGITTRLLSDIAHPAKGGQDD